MNVNGFNGGEANNPAVRVLHSGLTELLWTEAHHLLSNSSQT